MRNKITERELESMERMDSQYKPNSGRYDKISYAKCGNSSLSLPRIALGMWHNFGSIDDPQHSREMVLHAFDSGITHFDLANNYGPEPGSAESTMGRILKEDLAAYRDELIISSKAGHEMWAGPYGNNSSRKNLIASLNQSLRRVGVEYFDIFYTHRYDGVTPIEETAQALVDIVRSGRALYIGISKYPAEEAQKLYDLLREAHCPAIVAQYRYNMLERDEERSTFEVAERNGVGVVPFSPLAQGVLSDRYLNGIPEGSRAASTSQFLSAESLTHSKMEAVAALDALARERGEHLSQMALAWALRLPCVTSLVMGASSIEQIDRNIKATESAPFTRYEEEIIDKITLNIER